MNIITLRACLTFLILLPGTASFASDVSTATLSYGQFEPGHLDPEGPPVAVDWASPEGRKRLLRSKYNNDYFELSSNFQPQINPLYCGIASSVIVLNSMRLPLGQVPSQAGIEISKPEAIGGGTLKYPAYSQLTLLGMNTDRVKDRDVIELKSRNTKGQYNPGLTLGQLQGILESYGATVELHHAKSIADKDINAFRVTLQKVLADNEHYIIVNINGRVYGAATDGHISPLAAYDEVSDSVLILDVAGYLNPWHWVAVKDLYAAMHTKDGDNYRGYLVVSDKP
jgi:hypothetical protein